jgi:hypothetical protein
MATKKGRKISKKACRVPRENTMPESPAVEAPAVPRDAKGLWLPGTSPNPGGRPKHTPVTDAYRALLGSKVPGDKKGRTYAELIALGAIHRAIKGSIDALKEVTDRAEGRTRQAVELMGPGGGPIDISNLTPEQRDEELKALAAELGYVRAN